MMHAVRYDTALSPNNENIFQVSMTIIKGAKSNSLEGGSQKILHYEHDNLYLWDMLPKRKKEKKMKIKRY